MEFLRPATWGEALAAKAERPAAVPIAGGTDLMVELNFDRRRPEALLDLNRVRELEDWETAEGGRVLRLGASVPYARIVRELRAAAPALALAAHTVGSPQIRNRGCVGGNLGAASPAGDSHPALLAAGPGTRVEAESAARGTRLIPIDDFYTGVKRNALAEDELIRAVRIPVAAGPQQFSKVGTRNAMVIAVCAFAVALHPDPATGGGAVGAGIGSAGPTPIRPAEAEEFLTGELAARGLWRTGARLDDGLVRRFGELVAAAARPIDDVRGSAAYRRHALAVMARRTLAWTWDEYATNLRRAA
ncbi:FAD binding domain-containing protein [Phaeacidiphilus oryzae]|uniref:FAD binding domain-containing protein n=1 Tax=Phaeacidiphilus oryzae TaxID=348818 RepID=UPI00056CEDF2|nr:FAD binding domain-containing protein [Phaeacidiphilus oryzae]